MIKKQYKMTKVTGFARPATQLVSLAHTFTSDIFLEYQGETVNLQKSTKSIIDILSLGIRPGTKFDIKAIGIDEVQAIQSIEDYLSNKIITNCLERNFLQHE